jgi:hypothetical protein
VQSTPTEDFGTRSPPPLGVRADADVLAARPVAPAPVPELAGVWVGLHAYVDDPCAQAGRCARAVPEFELEV